MGGRSRRVGGLVLCLMGILGVCLVCGLPMWRETSFVGANIVTAQSVWDGLWLHCVLQATGQMQCRRHTTATPVPSDLQAGRALTLVSILTGFLAFMVTLLGGGVVNCRGQRPSARELPYTTSSKKRACLLGGGLCILSGVLCLVSVSWSAIVTASVYNDPLLASLLRRQVGSCIYVGWVSSLLLLLGGTLICLVCWERWRTPPSFYPSSNRDTLVSMVSEPWSGRGARGSLSHPHTGLYTQARGRPPPLLQEQASFLRDPSSPSDVAESFFMTTKPHLERYVSSRTSDLQSQYYYIMP